MISSVSEWSDTLENWLAELVFMWHKWWERFTLLKMQGKQGSVNQMDNFFVIFNSTFLLFHNKDM